ncbi:TPM domain-containing protein, partial [Mycobacterium tuberculosis]|uniref:TPM domain-containing protein n=1 Tax=Mycobacterium tuberculosis TaxID=1773 RepID=UPI000AE40103
VDDFTNPSDSAAWADQVAEGNGLGPSQYLLAIAVEGRSLYISADSSGPLSNGQLAAIEDAIAPLAGSGDWTGAITLAADEIQGDGGAGALRVTLIVIGVVAA